MIRRVLLLCALVALPVSAQEPDAPVKEVKLAPLCLEQADQEALAKKLTRYEVENAELKKMQGVPVGVVVLTVAIGVVVAGAAGTAAGFALAKK